MLKCENKKNSGFINVFIYFILFIVNHLSIIAFAHCSIALFISAELLVSTKMVVEPLSFIIPS